MPITGVIMKTHTHTVHAAFFRAACIFLAFTASSCAGNMDLESNWLVTSISCPDCEITRPTAAAYTPLNLFAVKNEGDENGREHSYRISGRSGTNSYKGTLTISGNTARVRFSTKNGQDSAPKSIGPKTDDPENTRQRLFFQALESGGKVSVIQNESTTELIWKNVQKNIQVHFKKISLENTQWELVQFYDGKSLTHIPQEIKRADVLFSENGTLYGSSGVNNFKARYTNAPSGRIGIWQMSTTRIAAANEQSAAFERRYIELLETVASFTLEGNGLHLLNADGEHILHYAML